MQIVHQIEAGYAERVVENYYTARDGRRAWNALVQAKRNAGEIAMESDQFIVLRNGERFATK